MSNRWRFLSVVCLLLSWASFFFLGYKIGKKSEERTVKIDTTYVEVNHVAPTPIAEKNVGVITVPFKISTVKTHKSRLFLGRK